MPIDPAVSKALKRAVEEAGQPTAIAPRLEAWLNKLSEGDDSEDVKKRNYDAVFSQIHTGPPGED